MVDPWPPSECARRFGHGCYRPTETRRALGLDALARQGWDGRGATIAVMIPFHNPHLVADAARDAARWGLPVPRIEVLKYGKVPDFDPAKASQAACAEEATVDVEKIHRTAPGAKITVVETPQDQTGGTAGMTELLDAVGWVSRIRPVTAVSMSWGAAEDNFAEEAGHPGDYHLLRRLRGGLKAAHRRGVTLIAASGNWGPTLPTLKGDALYGHRSAAFPAGDPLVTSVGGTRIHLDDHGHRTAPTEVWTAEGINAGGAGLSNVFPRPHWQHSARPVVGNHRGLVDIAANAAGHAREWYYSSVNVLPGQAPGWVRVAGTSIAAPEIAGLVAIAAQRARRHRLGDIHPALYAMTRHPAAAGLTDLATGTNTANNVPGFPARPGYSIPDGVGTPHDADRFITALATAATTH